MGKINNNISFSSSSFYVFLVIMIMGSNLLLSFPASTATQSADRPNKLSKYHHHHHKCALYRPANSGEGMHHHHRVKRIANGTAGDIRAMPWMVFVSTLVLLPNNANRLLNCTGSLVSPRHVLTADHCFQFNRMPNSSYTITVYYGSANKNAARSIVLQKSAAHRHPNVTSFLGNNRTVIVDGVPMVFRPLIIVNDMAILDLGQDLELADTVQPVCVACLNNNSTTPQGPVIIAGWGNINTLCSGPPPIYPDIFNYQSVGVHQCLTPEFEIANKVCTQADLTHGVGGTDSGGPALASYNKGQSFLQVGVNGANNCEAEQRENGFSKVDKQWFEKITGVKCKNFPDEE